MPYAIQSTYPAAVHKSFHPSQIQDDILDVTSTTETLGKRVGSDIINHKSTYVSLLGLEESQKRVEDLFEECLANVYGLQLNHGLMIELFQIIMKRVN